MTLRNLLSGAQPVPPDTVLGDARSGDAMLGTVARAAACEDASSQSKPIQDVTVHGVNTLTTRSRDPRPMTQLLGVRPPAGTPPVTTTLLA